MKISHIEHLGIAVNSIEVKPLKTKKLELHF